MYIMGTEWVNLVLLCTRWAYYKYAHHVCTDYINNESKLSLLLHMVAKFWFMWFLPFYSDGDTLLKMKVKEPTDKGYMFQNLIILFNQMIMPEEDRIYLTPVKLTWTIS